ncbi:MAG: Type 1 glutamine amidotransferase-like domain-containing protein [Planctomycetes bacterium]|nr:Type 1 glutamine amidotransferase-like domain-containing protein [Planctomycetota bacterium]
MRHRWLLLATLTLFCLQAACSTAATTGRRGTLLLIGGGLDDDHAPTYRRLLELANGPGLATAKMGPQIVVVTAATGPEEQEAIDKTEALRTWCWSAGVEVVRRATPTAATVAAIDRAGGLLFTGGDQQRILARYRPDGQDTPEWLAMQRLLQRGGVIAGGSAGCAMMGELMLLGGSSAAALGAPTADGSTPEASTRLGPGMQFLPWAITDSHFFERQRIGRLVQALEASGRRFGIGVGEDATVEVDLATGTLRGLGTAASLLIDAGHLQREGTARRRLVARLLGDGERVSLAELQRTPGPAPRGPVARPFVIEVPVVEPGQNRQLASWRMFHQAATPNSGNLWRLQLDGWRILAWAEAPGVVGFDVEVGN